MKRHHEVEVEVFRTFEEEFNVSVTQIHKTELWPCLCVMKIKTSKHKIRDKVDPNKSVWVTCCLTLSYHRYA